MAKIMSTFTTTSSSCGVLYIQPKSHPGETMSHQLFSPALVSPILQMKVSLSSCVPSIKIPQSNKHWQHWHCSLESLDRGPKCKNETPATVLQQSISRSTRVSTRSFVCLPPTDTAALQKKNAAQLNRLHFIPRSSSS